jgi:streptogramin lyase
MTYTILAATAAPLVLAAFAAAQETYWVPNRFSNDMHEVTAYGHVVRSVALGISPRGVHTAPDGKLWIAPFSGQFQIYDPVANTQTGHTFALGTAYDIAFDANGHAWVSGGTGVEEFDAAGNSIAPFPLPAGAPLGITIDSQGNKWIAHRVGPPGSISRIDGATGAITNHPLAATSLILPTKTYADFRGVLQPSHIWVIGDNRGAGELVEFDSAGTLLNTYVLGTGSTFAFGSICEDLAGRLYVGNFSNGNVHQIDRTSGAVLQTYPVPPSVLGLAIDGFGALWATVRNGNTTTSPPSEVKRIDTATGAIEVPATTGIASSWPLSTRWQHAMVVNPVGDLDGDGAVNFAELTTGDSPFDGCSRAGQTFSTSGSTQIGNTCSLDFGAGGGFFFAFAGGTVPAGAGLTVPGIGCAVQLDLATLYPGSSFVLGPASLPFSIPNVPAYIGSVVHMQALAAGVGLSFTNVTGVKVW